MSQPPKNQNANRRSPSHKGSSFKNPLAIALLGSVLINGVLLGALATKHKIRKVHTQAHWQAQGQAQGQAQAHSRPKRAGRADELPHLLNPKERKRFDQLARQTVGTDMQEARKQLQKSRESLNRAMRAETFDPDALSAAMATVRANRNAIAQISDRAISSYLEQASPDERIKILQRMSRTHRSNEGKGRKSESRRENPAKKIPTNPGQEQQPSAQDP